MRECGEGTREWPGSLGRLMGSMGRCFRKCGNGGMAGVKVGSVDGDNMGREVINQRVLLTVS